MTPPTCGYCGTQVCEDHDLETTAAYRKGQKEEHDRVKDIITRQKALWEVVGDHYKADAATQILEYLK